MENVSIALAATVSFLAFAAHVSIGTKQNAAPILDDASLPDGPRRTLAFSWQANSVLLLFMTFGFAAAFYFQSVPLLAFNATLAAVLGGLALLVSVRSSVNPLKFPPAPLFLAIAAFGIYGWAS